MYNRNNNGKGGTTPPPHDSKRYKAYKVFYESNLSKFSFYSNLTGSSSNIDTLQNCNKFEHEKI